MYRDNSSGGMVRLVDINSEGQTRTAKTFNELTFPENI
jgi:hypothetical protein